MSVEITKGNFELAKAHGTNIANYLSAGLFEQAERMRSAAISYHEPISYIEATTWHNDETRCKSICILDFANNIEKFKNPVKTLELIIEMCQEAEKERSNYLNSVDIRPFEFFANAVKALQVKLAEYKEPETDYDVIGPIIHAISKPHPKHSEIADCIKLMENTISEKNDRNK